MEVLFYFVSDCVFSPVLFSIRVKCVVFFFLPSFVSHCNNVCDLFRCFISFFPSSRCIVVKSSRVLLRHINFVSCFFVVVVFILSSL